MSLLDDFARECVMLEKTVTPDGAGGYITTWRDGVSFKNYQALNSSTEAVIAERQGVAAIYYGLVDKDLPLEYGDYYRDAATGNTYRVTSRPEDKIAPKSSTLKLKYFTAERKELPS